MKGWPGQVPERRVQLVGSMLQPSDNILLAAAPSGLLLMLLYFFSLELVGGGAAPGSHTTGLGLGRNISKRLN